MFLGSVFDFINNECKMAINGENRKELNLQRVLTVLHLVQLILYSLETSRLGAYLLYYSD